MTVKLIFYSIFCAFRLAKVIRKLLVTCPKNANNVCIHLLHQIMLIAFVCQTSYKITVIVSLSLTQFFLLKLTKCLQQVFIENVVRTNIIIACLCCVYLHSNQKKERNKKNARTSSPKNST